MVSRMTARRASHADRPQFADASEAGIFAQIRADARRNEARPLLEGLQGRAAVRPDDALRVRDCPEAEYTGWHDQYERLRDHVGPGSVMEAVLPG